MSVKIGIIGGGAAGLTCAINAKSKDNEVVILERNTSCGKKILITGNGRCNYWNVDQNINHYESSTNYLIPQLINEESEEYVMNFFNELGIVPKIKNGYYYPKSNQAITIKNALVEEAIERNVEIKYNYLVESIRRKNNKFIVNDDLEFDILVIATGSYAYPNTGSDGIIKPLPALVQLNTKKYSFLKKWSGIRADVRVSFLEKVISNADMENSRDLLKQNYFEKVNDEIFVYKQQDGEIQLTDYGISGICVFNLSNTIGRALDNNKKTLVEIDFLTDMDISNYLMQDKSIKRILDCLLNNKLVDIILEELHIDKNIKFRELKDIEKDKLLRKIHRFEVEIVSTKGFENAQVSSGGVSLEEIDLLTMESKLVPNLYIVGELLDITGECGGYNLGIAFRSGVIAGLTIRGDFDD